MAPHTSETSFAHLQEDKPFVLDYIADPHSLVDHLKSSLFKEIIKKTAQNQVLLTKSSASRTLKLMIRIDR